MDRLIKENLESLLQKTSNTKRLGRRVGRKQLKKRYNPESYWLCRMVEHWRPSAWQLIALVTAL